MLIGRISGLVFTMYLIDFGYFQMRFFVLEALNRTAKNETKYELAL